MSIARRNFLVFAAATALAREAAWGDDGRARFWRVEMPDGGQGIVFGYARIAAAITLDIVCDGTRLVGEARRVVLDMDNVKLPAMKIDATLPPILSRLDSARADEVRKILAAMHVPQAQLDGLSGFMVATLLHGEGQTNPMPSVGGVTMDRVKALGRPVVTLLGQADVDRLRRPVDFAALDRTITPQTIAFLLDTRRQIGPIGAHSDGLYRARKSEELDRFTKLLADHGVPESGSYLDADASKPGVAGPPVRSVAVTPDR
jgi:hypothetical protein